MSQIKELIHLGKEYFDRKEYHKAERFLMKVVDANPNYADVHNLLGVINHVGGRFQTAINCFEKALKINPKYTEAMLNLAVLYNDLGQYSDAKKIYTKLKKNSSGKGSKIEPVLKGKLSNLHAEIGDIYRSIGMYSFSIQEYRKALDLNPSYLDIRTKLGQALRENGDTKESLKELKNVVKVNKKYNPARVQMGVTLYAQGEISQAKKTWNEALKQNPYDQYAKMYLRLCGAQEITKQRAAKRLLKKLKRKL